MREIRLIALVVSIVVLFIGLWFVIQNDVDRATLFVVISICINVVCAK
jgi:uncharacterized membrane protein